MKKTTARTTARRVWRQSVAAIVTAAFTFSVGSAPAEARSWSNFRMEIGSAPAGLTRPVALPVWVSFFDSDGDGRIEFSELFETVEAWAREWRDWLVKPAAAAEGRCDLNGDEKCDLTDLSVLLYYVGR